jgi:hypothetical protein
MFVYLWLPLFALSMMLAKSLNHLRIAVGGAQWFFKRGKDHPIEAIGYVAAIIVFVLSAIYVWILAPAWTGSSHA